MPVTSPDSITYPDASTTGGFIAAIASMATSIQAALLKRGRKSYQWADAAARTAQAGMSKGDTGYQVDTDLVYRYDGTNWRLWEKFATSFTPTWTNVTITGATQGATYSISGGIVHVDGFFTLGASSAIGTGPYMALPVPANGYITSAPNSGNDRALGVALCEDAGVALYEGKVTTKAVSSVIYAALSTLNASGTYATVSALSAAIPFAFGNGDFITYHFQYIAD